MDKGQLRSKIEVAFSGSCPPTHHLTGMSSEKDEGVSDYFSGTTWEGHEVSTLRHYCAALSFFEPEAFHYYLPAFILADLQDPIEADVIGSHIVYSFVPPDLGNSQETKTEELSRGGLEQNFEKRMNLFSLEELEAVEAYIEYCDREYGTLDDENRKALRYIRSLIELKRLHNGM